MTKLENSEVTFKPQLLVSVVNHRASIMDALTSDGSTRMVLTLDIQGHAINPQTGHINQDELTEGTLVFSIEAVPDLLEAFSEIAIEMMTSPKSAE